MSATVLCPGCGLQVAVPPDHTRPKLRCPECGVMCDVPDAVREKAAAPAAPPSPPPAREVRPPKKAVREPEPASRPAAEPVPPPAAEEPADLPAPVQARVRMPKGTIYCGRCGELVRAPRGKRKKEWRCPVCGAPPPETAVRPADPPRPAPPPAPLPDPEPELPATSDRDDNLPYAVDRATERRCPTCSAVLPLTAVLCVRCGLDLRTRQKLARSYEPIRRQWEPGLPARKRWLLFLLAQAAGAPLFLWAALEGEVALTVFSWLFYTVLLSFLLGTFSHIEVERNERGQARLKVAWRVCFLPRRPGVIPWQDYDAVVTGKARVVGPEDWLVVLALLPVGILPAILWWYYVIERDRFTVSLARDHGFPALRLYCGYSEAQREEMAATLRDATGLPLQRA